MTKYKMYLLVCGGTGCRASASDSIVESLKQELENKGFSDEVQVIMTGCFGFCEKGPIVKVLPDEAFYVEVKPGDAAELVAEHVVKGRTVERLLYKEDESKEHAKIDDLSFYQKQVRIVLRNCGFINPENIEEYIARDGYAALEKVLTEMTPQQVLNELKESGLRGRG